MKKISSYMMYEKGMQVKPHVLYITGSDKIILEGNVEFLVLGTCRMNGIKLTNMSMNVLLCKATSFEVEKDSAILFGKVPMVVIPSHKHVPVPDIPDMLDAQTAQMHYMFEQWARKKGIKLKDEEVHDEVEVLDEDEDENDYDLHLPLSLDVHQDSPPVEPWTQTEIPELDEADMEEIPPAAQTPADTESN